MNDHHKLGRELELFHSAPLIGAGLPIWLPDGAVARHAVESYLYDLERAQRVPACLLATARQARNVRAIRPSARTSPTTCSHPWTTWSSDPACARTTRWCSPPAAARTASCPCASASWAACSGPNGRVSSAGCSGYARSRSTTAHIFCAPEQVVAEAAQALRLMKQAQHALGFEPSSIRLSLRGEGGKYVDDPAMWDRAEQELREALKLADVPYVEAPGEAAFYGPKIDIQVLIGGRESTLATVQVDHYQPARFDLSYVDADGEKKRPVMVHRSAAGSLERLFAHLIEVHGGCVSGLVRAAATGRPAGRGRAGRRRSRVRSRVPRGRNPRRTLDRGECFFPGTGRRPAKGAVRRGHRRAGGGIRLGVAA